MIREGCASRSVDALARESIRHHPCKGATSGSVQLEISDLARDKMIRPTAMVIGPMKAGTTWIHNYLLSRGDVRLPSQVKETFFFDRYYDRGSRWYSDHFAKWRDRGPAQTVEVAPSLFHNPEAPRRIRETLGAIPLVVTTRDPVARSWSHYLHMRRYGYTREPLCEAIREFPEILEASRYDSIVAHWRSALPGSSITLLPLEELQQDPDSYVAQLCASLNLSFIPAPESLSGREYAAAVPPSFMLARLGATVARTLRSAGLYSVLNSAKAMGLRSVFFGDGARGRTVGGPSEADLIWLRSALAHD